MHAIKTDSIGDEKFKSRFVIRRHLDPEKSTMVKDAANILRSSPRLIIKIASTINFEAWYRDFKRPFIQSEDTVHPELNVYPPKRSALLSMTRNLQDCYKQLNRYTASLKALDIGGRPSNAIM